MTDLKMISIPEKLIRNLIAVKNAAEGKKALFSCQGQAMDGITEDYNYRHIVGEIIDFLGETHD